MNKLTNALLITPLISYFIFGCIRTNTKIERVANHPENRPKINILSLAPNNNKSFSYTNSSSNLIIKNSKHTPSIYLAIPLDQVRLPEELAEEFANSGFVTVAVDEPSSNIQTGSLGLKGVFSPKINWTYSRKFTADPLGPGLIPSQYAVTKRGVLSGEPPIFSGNKFDRGIEYQVVQDIHRFKKWIENGDLNHREQVKYKESDYENVLDFRGRIYGLLSKDLKNHVSVRDLNHRISIAMHYSTQTFDADLSTILLPEFNKRVKSSNGESWRQASSHPENHVTFSIDGDHLKVKRTVVFEHFSTMDESFLGNLGYTNREISINLRTGDISPEKASIVWRSPLKEERVKAFSALLLAGSAFIVAAGIIHKDDIQVLIDKWTQKKDDPKTQDTELEDHFVAESVTLEIKEDTKGTLVGVSDSLSAGFIEIEAGTYQGIQYFPKISKTSK